MSELEWIDIFGDNLRDMLIEANMTQRDLAEDTGLTEAAISNYINKRRMPTVRALVNISFYLGCSFDELMDSGDRVE
jgi:transcriptional regulator with XRE-family HTH domain